MQNKVAESGIVALDLETLVELPPMTSFDLADLLEEGLLLREAPFKQKLAMVDWSRYQGKWVALHCSTGAIVPQWAWMLVCRDASRAGIAMAMKSPESLRVDLFLNQLETALRRMEVLDGGRVVVKGCGSGLVPVEAYAALTTWLAPRVKSLMYGEPCSTVPVLKNK